MSWNYNEYEEYLRQQLEFINQEKGLELNLHVTQEQAFVKTNALLPNDVYVLLKYLSSDLQLNAKIQNVQILILSEENSLDKARELMNEYSQRNNYKINVSGTTYVQHNYTTPTVISNFNDIGIGKRSLLYVSAVLTIMESTNNVRELTIDDESILPVSFVETYAMTGNTQPVNMEYLSSTEKTMSTYSLSMTMPNIKCDFIDKINDIIYGRESGNTVFEFEFYNGDSTTKEHVELKLTSVNKSNVIGQVPSIQVGFIK